MTICISILCPEDNAVVVGADRMITDHGIPIEFEASTPKFSTHWNGDDVSLIFASAGSALSPSTVRKQLDFNMSEIGSFREAVNTVKQAYLQIKKRKFEESVLAPRGISLDEFYSSKMPETSQGQEWDRMYSEFTLELQIILAGVDGRGAHTFRVSDGGEYAGLVESFNGLGFDAIGSGSSLARDTLTSRYEHDFSVEHALYVMYSALENASQAPGVGRNFDIAVIRRSENIRQLSQEEMGELGRLFQENEEPRSVPDDISEILDGV